MGFSILGFILTFGDTPQGDEWCWLKSSLKTNKLVKHWIIAL